MKEEYKTHQQTYTQLQGPTRWYHLLGEVLIDLAFVPVILYLNTRDKFSFKRNKLESKV